MGGEGVGMGFGGMGSLGEVAWVCEFCEGFVGWMDGFLGPERMRDFMCGFCFCYFCYFCIRLLTDDGFWLSSIGVCVSLMFDVCVLVVFDGSFHPGSTLFSSPSSFGR